MLINFNRVSKLVLWSTNTASLPGCALCEKIWFSGHEFGPESSHFLLHLPHLSIEPFSDVAKLRIDDAEVSQLDGYITFYSTLSHFAYLLVEQVNPLCDVGVSHVGTFTFFVHALYHGLGMPLNREFCAQPYAHYSTRRLARSLWPTSLAAVGYLNGCEQLLPRHTHRDVAAPSNRYHRQLHKWKNETTWRLTVQQRCFWYENLNSAHFRPSHL